MTDPINIMINGVEYFDFTDVTITKSIETFAGKFVITTTSTSNIDFPLKVNSECKILVQGEPVINGYIESLIIDYDDKTHSIQVTGRDRTADLVDSTVGGSDTSEFQLPTKGLTLKQITESLLTKFNLSSIKVIDNHGTKPFKKGDIVSAEYGTKVFDFLEKYAKKRQVLLTTDGNGDIVFTRTPTKQYITPLLLSDTEPSTILRGSIRYNNSKRYNKYLCTTQDNPAALDQFIDTSKITSPSKVAGNESVGQATDNEVRSSRIYHFESESSSSSEPLNDRAKWEANFRKSQASKWSYTVQGHIAKDDSMIWKPGYKVLVVDSFANLNSYALISSVEYKFNLTGGSKTVLKLLPDIAFSLLITKPENEAAATDTGLSQYIDITKLNTK